MGLRVYNPAKVGRDAGELIGQEPVGIVATDDLDELLALEADCVLYNALGSALVDLSGPVDDLVRLLESGKNVVSSALDAVRLFQARHRNGLRRARAGRADPASLRRRRHIHLRHTGMTPGFAIDLSANGDVTASARRVGLAARRRGGELLVRVTSRP